MPPISPSSSASPRNAARIAPREKPERAQRADLAGARRDARVHGDHRADHRADREDDRDRRAEIADELRQRLRLLGVEALLALRLERQPRVAFDRRLHRVELIRIVQPEQHRRDSRCGETPAASARRRPRSPNRTPVCPASKTPTTVQSRDAKRSVSPRPAPWNPSAIERPAMTSAVPGRNMRPSTSLHLRPQLEARRRHAADHDVRRLAGAALRQVDQHDRFLRDQRPSVGRQRQSPAGFRRSPPAGARCRFALRSASCAG